MIAFWGYQENTMIKRSEKSTPYFNPSWSKSLDEDGVTKKLLLRRYDDIIGTAPPKTSGNLKINPNQKGIPIFLRYQRPSSHPSSQG